MFGGFSKFNEKLIVRGKFLKIWSFINLLWGHVRSHAKFGPDWFSRFDFYWMQTGRHPDRQTDKQTSKVDIQIQDP